MDTQPREAGLTATAISFLLRALTSVFCGGLLGGVLLTAVMSIFLLFHEGSGRCGGDPASICPHSRLDFVLFAGLFYGIWGIIGGAVLLSGPVYYFLFVRKKS